MKYFRTARGKPYPPSQPTSQNSCFLQFQFLKFLVTSTPISKTTVIKVEVCQNLRGSDAFDKENCEKACLLRHFSQCITPISVRSIFTLTYYYSTCTSKLKLGEGFVNARGRTWMLLPGL